MPNSNSLDLSVTADAPDFRDRYYEPSLRALQTTNHPPGNLYILDQGVEGACTGFGLAATINLLYRQRDEESRVSARMLYDLARRYDAWAGEDYEGSSCRGAIKGWKNSGVCTEALCPFEANGKFEMTPAISEDARQRTLGAYYRLRPIISDFHAALNESGVVYASAKVHSGWFNPAKDKDGEAVMPMRDTPEGGHAFAIVGYNSKGFWIQNSWGDDWGDDGLALWLYEDWASNIMDAWVVQLALPTPQIFDATVNAGNSSSANDRAERSSPARGSIINHFVHLDDGRYHDKGRYWSNEKHMEVVQAAIERSGCEHLLLWAHGGLNSTKDAARRIAALRQVFMDNGIYPFHFMYDTGLGEELKDVVFRNRENAERVSGGVRDWFDRRIEDLTRKPGRALWREMKFGAEEPFRLARADGTDVLKRLIESIRAVSGTAGIHVAGHSTGAILHAHALSRLIKIDEEIEVSTCSFLAPAATNALFNEKVLPLLHSGNLKELTIYNLSDAKELNDDVAKVYGKSLLYLVSRAFEDDSNAKLLGMAKYNRELALDGLPANFVYASKSDTGRTRSATHGGFDNDLATMNDLLRRVLGAKPLRPFREGDLNY